MAHSILPDANTARPAGVVDITTRFFEAVENMIPGKVAKSPYFQMVDGARAVEVGNRRLDTSLTQLTREEIDFDCSKPQDIDTVVSVMDELLIRTMCWLEGLSLLVTVLSCRYVATFLANFMGGTKVQNVTFETPRLATRHTANPPDGDEKSRDAAVNVVLRAFVAGLCKFLGTVKFVASQVLYDEEDLIMRAMDFDLLALVLPTEVTAILDQAIAAAEQTLLFSAALPYLRFVRCLVETDTLVDAEIDLYSENDDGTSSEFLLLAREQLQRISDTAPALKIAPGTFSKFVQVDCNNKHIPFDLATMDRAKAMGRFGDLVRETQFFFSAVQSVKSAGQLVAFLQYAVDGSSWTVFSRGLFQLFLLRDDKSIAGLDESVWLVSLKIMEGMCLAGNGVMSLTGWESADLLARFNQLTDSMEQCMFYGMCRSAHNPSRQRQLLNKDISILDALQANAESLEIELYENGIGDRLHPQIEQPALGLGLFLYFYKLQVMVEFTLSGFALDVYHASEAPATFWFTSYLCKHLEFHVSRRIREINVGKQASVVSMQKKVKKAKARPKKEELKQELRKLEALSPQLADNILYIDGFVLPQVRGLQLLASAVHSLLLLYSVSGAPEPQLSTLSTPRLTYMLRFKPFASVGTPETPTYEEYIGSVTPVKNLKNVHQSLRKSKVNMIGAQIKTELSQALAHFNSVVAAVRTETGAVKNVVSPATKPAIEAHFSNLAKTCIMYLLELGRLLKRETGENCTIKQKPGSHRWFPIYYLEES